MGATVSRRNQTERRLKVCLFGQCFICLLSVWGSTVLVDKVAVSRVHCGAVLVTPKDADTSYRMVIEATTHHCLFQTSWSKNLSESAHPAFTVLATVFNNKLTSKLIMLDFDVRDGEVRLRCALPVGVMAKDPSTMVRKYIEMLRLANTTLLGVIAAEEAWLETPIEAGTEMAKGMDVVLAMFLKKQAES